jgi:DNA-binding response OmpR family regulator
MICPHCGGYLAGGRMQLHDACFDDAGRAIRVLDERRPLRRQTWRVLTLLRERAGHLVSVDYLARASSGADGGSIGSIRIAIFELRQALSGTPYVIASRKGHGYGLFRAAGLDVRQYRV